MKEKKRDTSLDIHTEQYIKNVKRMLLIILLVVGASSIFFVHTVIYSNKDNLKRVALAEVEESMQETVNNICIHIDEVRERVHKEARVEIDELYHRIQNGTVSEANDLLAYLNVCEDNSIGRVLEIIYTEKNGVSYYINRYERKVFYIDGEKERIYKDSSFYEIFTIDENEYILFVKQAELDKIVKNEIHDYLHSEVYSGNQYVWVNEIFNLDGGANYAVRRIHPNLVESEGEYLTTYMTDVMGNYPYKTELQGIREKGYVFHSYYFKNKVNNEITEKYSYAQYYEPFKWIIATGETIEEVYAFSEEVNTRSFDQIFALMLIFGGMFSIASWAMIRGLGKQSQTFRKTLLKQMEVFEDIYTVMSIGLLRIRMTDESCEVLQVNPKGLEAFGVDSKDEFLEKIHGYKVETMVLEDAEKLEEACKSLSEQWESVVTECHVEWKDGSVRLIRVRDTLVEIELNAKVIQRMCQDITEERYQQEQAILLAEEKATLDPMTQIKNKKSIETILRTQIMEAATAGTSIAIGFVDIDNFRDYNTKYGHMQGDEVIKYVADTIKEAVPGIVGRNGGDEFTFVIPKATYEVVEEAMKVIHKKLNEGVIIKDTGENVPTPCSIGVIIECGSELDYEYMMEQSDAAMYEAKARGKNTYYILDRRKNM